MKLLLSLTLSGLLLPMLLVPISSAADAIAWGDDFETGDFARWSGTRASTGETITVVAEDSAHYHYNEYMARATSDGVGSSESAYCYKRVSASQLYAFGYFNLAKSGIVENGDRLYFIVLKAGGVNVAYAGVRKVNDVLKWTLLIKNGTSNVVTYSSGSFASYDRCGSAWYCVELFWRKHASFGGGELWVNEYHVCSAGGRNTAIYGNVTEVQMGLPAAYGCGSVKVNFDDVSISSTFVSFDTPFSSGDLPLLFDDGFECGFGRWDRVLVSPGGAANPVKSVRFTGLCSGMFSYKGYGQTSTVAVRKNIDSRIWLVIKTRVRVSTCSPAVDSARFYMVRVSSNETRLAYVGWKAVHGVLRWCLCVLDGPRTVFAYSTSAPSLNTWYSIELNWLGADYWGELVNCIVSLKVNGNEVCRINGNYTATYTSANRVDFGLPMVVQFTNVKVYCDNCMIMEYVGT